VTNETDLQRLCDYAGLQRSYWDGLGQHRTLSLEDCRTLLAAMGLDGMDDPASEIDRGEDLEWQRVLPPVMVCRQASSDYHIPITLPVGQWKEPVSWVLVEEDGSRHQGEVRAETLVLWGRREIGGSDRERRGFDRLPDLPPGYHRFALPGLDVEMPFIMAAETGYRPQAAPTGDSAWGLSVQLYGLRSERNWGIGDLSDLTTLGLLAADQGASFIGINPLHAHALTEPDHRSPYAASSRLFLDPIYLDVEAIPHYRDCDQARQLVDSEEFQAELARLRSLSLVDYEAVASVKQKALQRLYRHFKDTVLETNSDDARDFLSFVEQGGTELHRYAMFETIRNHHRDSDGKPSRPKNWPAPLQDPAGAQAEIFAENHADETGFHLFLQWQADRQLRAVADAFRRAGMSIGLYRDLAVGPSPDGAERWSNRETFAPSINAGAPPDAFSADGQNWNLPVFVPEKLRLAAYKPFIRLLRENMKHAGALRIDHVMGLTRLFWIPDGSTGADGAYVTYPGYDLLGIVALESQRNKCIVVGEDLGSVPEGFRQDLAAAGILGTRVLLFERDQDGNFLDPRGWPALSIAAASTHDLPPLAGFWTGKDIDIRQEIDGSGDNQHFQNQRAARNADRERLKALIDRESAQSNETLASPEDAVTAIQALLRRSPCLMIQYQLDDVLAEVTPVNIPGTWREYPNWRRKQALTLEELATDRSLSALPKASAHI